MLYTAYSLPVFLQFMDPFTANVLRVICFNEPPREKQHIQFVWLSFNPDSSGLNVYQLSINTIHKINMLCLKEFGVIKYNGEYAKGGIMVFNN